MAIDFNQVKTVTIPEGPVCEITDSTGNILWEGVGWHTIWEGNKTCSFSAIGTDAPVLEGAEDNFAQTKSGTGYTPKIRISCLDSRFDTGTTSFAFGSIINGSWKDADVPFIVNIDTVDNSADPVVICAPAYHRYINLDYAYAYAGIRKRRDTENNRIIFDMYTKVSNNITSYGGNFTITFTVTKIEQYY